MSYYYNPYDDKLTKLQIAGIAIGGVVVFIVLIGFFILCTCAWDYKTGKDTGYISAVDKMTLTDDYTIYLRRRPLDAAVTLKGAESDETKYCTTPEYKDVVEKAYKAIENGKRVVLTYDKPREFGWRKIGGCNSTAVTGIEFVEE